MKSFKHEVRTMCLPKTWANFAKIWSKCYRPLMGHEIKKCTPKWHETSFVLSCFTHEQSVSLFKNESKALSCCKLLLLVFICFFSSWSHVCPFECNPFPFPPIFFLLVLCFCMRVRSAWKHEAKNGRNHYTKNAIL